MGIVDALKDIYFKWEEQYYALLDKIDAKIPIYKIIDPVDKIVPSFALLIILVALLLIIAGVTIVGWLAAPTTTTLKLIVVDDEGYAVPDTTVTFKIAREVVAKPLTNEQGIAELSGLDLETGVEIIAEKEGYLSNDTELIILEFPIQEERIKITLESRGFTTRTIRLVDGLGMAIAGNFTLSFACSNPYANPPDPTTLTAADNGATTAQVPNNCEKLRVTISDLAEYGDYGPVEVVAEPFIIRLERAAIEDATIAAVIATADGDPIDDITVELYRYNELAANPNVGPIDVEYTIGGMAEFSWPAGSYVLKTYDSAGVYGEEQSDRIDVAAGESKTVTLSLKENIKGHIKIQVNDKRTGEIIDNARVTLYIESNNSELTNLTTDVDDDDGIVTFNISRDVVYKAVVEAEDYALGMKFGLRISTSVIAVELERCTPLTCGTLLVRVVDQDGDFVENAAVALYNARTSFLAGYRNKITDINGLAKFRGVGSGNYEAFAFKESIAGWSDETYFSSTASDDNTVDLTVVMQIPDGTIRVNVRDRDGLPLPYPIISIYNTYNNELIGSDYGDVNGLYNLATKADKRVYIVVKKKDSVPKMADYTTVARPVLPSTVQVFDVIMQPEIINKEVEIKFLGLYKGDKLAVTLGIGGEYTAKLQLRIPEEKDYAEAGIHLRTGKDIIMEKDQLFIKSLNAPHTYRITATSYDENSGLGADEYGVTASDAKWANIVWPYPEAGIYEVEAVIKVKETASVGDELLIYYRAWAQNDEKIRDPEDEYVVEELYAETYTERYQVGVTTLCDKEFCFSSSITDLEEGLTESITESYQAKIYNEYLWKFTLQNNSDTGIHDKADLRIENRDEGILFGSYLIYDAQSRPIAGTVNDYEFERIDVGRLEPKNKINAQEIYFVTQKALPAVINIRLVSDQRIVFEKNLTISIMASKELETVVSPTSYPSGVENDINVLVRDKGTKLEIEDAIVRVKDKFGNVIIYDSTRKDGYAFLTIPAQKPGTKLWIEVEKPNYNTAIIEIEINPNVLEIQPERIGVSLNIKTKTEADDKFSVRNIATFELKIADIKLEGDFRALLDEERIANWLEASYKDLHINPNERVEMHLKTYLSDDGKVIEERTDLEGSLVIDASNFGQTWVFVVPVNIAIGLGDEVDNPACLVLTRGDWITSTEGEPISLEFKMQNNCTVAGNPVGLRQLEAKVEWKGNHLGGYSITIGENETGLRPGYFRTLLGRIPAEAGYSAILTFTPYGGMIGTDEAEIVIQARNPLEEEDQLLTAKIKTKITVINIKQCVSFDRDLIEMEYGQSATFTITTNGCGEPVNFELLSDLDLSADEFTMGADASQAIEVLAEENYPGQYPVFIKSKLASEAKKQLIHTIRTRIKVLPTDCIKLNRYEFDVYDSPEDEYDGYDTAELSNRCVEKDVSFKVDMKDFMAALKDGAKWGLIVFGVSILGKGLGSLLPEWAGGEGKGERIRKVADVTFRDEKYYTDAKGHWYHEKSGEVITRPTLIKDLERELRETEERPPLPPPQHPPPPIAKPPKEYVPTELQKRFIDGYGAEWPEYSYTADPNGSVIVKDEQDRGYIIPKKDLQDFIDMLERWEEEPEEEQAGGEWTGEEPVYASPKEPTLPSTATGYYALIDLMQGKGVAVPYEEIPTTTGYFLFGGGEGLLGGGSGLFGMGSNMIDSILGKGNPIMQGLKTWLIASLASYMGQEGEKEFSVTKPDLEIEDANLLVAIGKEEVEDDDVSVAQPEEEYVERDIETGRKVKKMGLVFTNETGFTTTEEEPAYKWLKVTGIHHMYNTDKTYNKADFDVINEKGWFDFSAGEERIDPTSGGLEEKEPEEVKQYFHLEFNSVPPEGPAEEVRGLLNCQAGTKQGTTGDSAFFGEKAPLRIKLDWDWASIDDDECDVGNEEFIYCDATQFSIDLLKKINMINGFLIDNGSLLVCPTDEEGAEQCEPYSTKRLGGAAGFFQASGMEGTEVEAIEDTITFQTHLIRDRYSPDFQSDFDSYSQLESFFNAPTYYTDDAVGLGIYFRDFELLKFAPKYGEANPEGYLLPGPGIYNVTINITYNDDSWQLFDNEGQPNATIRIELDKADVPEPDSPFYYLPFDGPIGFDGRVGYGVNYRGDVVIISNDPEAVRTIEMAGSTPIPNGQLTVTYSDSFKRLNNDERGEIFTITRGETPTIVYSPSYATPVMMKIHNEKEDAFGFYEVESGGGAQNVGPSMSKWYGIGINCKSFSDRPVVEEFWETADMHGLRQYRQCSVLPEEKAATSYGFEFCNPVLFGNLYLKSIFYTPYGKDSYMKKVAGNDSMALIGNIAADLIELNGARDLPTEINTVEDMIDLIKDGYVCVSSTDTKAEFWWNPKVVFESDDFQSKEDQAINDCITD